MQVVVEIQDKSLKALLAKLKDIDAGLESVGEGWRELVRQGFKDSKDPYGKKWAKLKDASLQAFVRPNKRRKEYGDKPLLRQGVSMNSFTYQVRSGQLELGSPSAWLKYHQGDSGHVSKGIMPQRMMLPTADKPLPKEWLDEAIQAIEAALGLEA